MMTEAAVKISEQEFEAQLPKPIGYRLLIALPQVSETYEGTKVLRTDKERDREHIMSIIGLVVDMGEQCYSDPDRFPTGPWCKEGDFVLTRPYAGTRVVIHGREFRIINDDTVEAVVEDPRGIRRA